jgi:ABC-type nitrate/sulfonate/bicarbonate transport system substrate-binding protein
MNLRGKRQILLAVFLLFFSVIANTDDTYAQKLRVAYTAFAGTFTILWVGKDAGLYLKHGADMDLLFIGSNGRAGAARRRRRYRLLRCGAVVDANLSGADLVMVGWQYDKGQISFFTTAPIASVGELKGKALGVSRFGAFSDFVARHVLKKVSAPPIKEVALIQLGGTREIVAGMQNNLVQADRFRCR